MTTTYTTTKVLIALAPPLPLALPAASLTSHGACCPHSRPRHLGCSSAAACSPPRSAAAAAGVMNMLWRCQPPHHRSWMGRTGVWETACPPRSCTATTLWRPTRRWTRRLLWVSIRSASAVAVAAAAEAAWTHTPAVVVWRHHPDAIPPVVVLLMLLLLLLLLLVVVVVVVRLGVDPRLATTVPRKLPVVCSHALPLLRRVPVLVQVPRKRAWHRSRTVGFPAPQRSPLPPQTTPSRSRVCHQVGAPAVCRRCRCRSTATPIAAPGKGTTTHDPPTPDQCGRLQGGMGPDPRCTGCQLVGCWFTLVEARLPMVVATVAMVQVVLVGASHLPPATCPPPHRRRSSPSRFPTTRCPRKVASSRCPAGATTTGAAAKAGMPAARADPPDVMPRSAWGVVVVVPSPPTTQAPVVPPRRGKRVLRRDMSDPSHASSEDHPCRTSGGRRLHHRRMAWCATPRPRPRRRRRPRPRPSATQLLVLRGVIVLAGLQVVCILLPTWGPTRRRRATVALQHCHAQACPPPRCSVPRKVGAARMAVAATCAPHLVRRTG